ncbi:MAG: hypothetical protein RL536_116, partial [Candidatus Parcubacteria bacterium]
MKSHSLIGTVLTIIIVVAFVWGLGYLIVKAIEAYGSSTILVKTTSLSTEVSTSTKPIEKIRSIFDSDKLTVMMGGDVMLDRSIRAYGERSGYDSLFDDSVVSLFKKADIVVANLEGPITSNPSKTLVNGKTTDSLTFTFSKNARKALTHAGIDIVSLANNHMDNFGFLGFLETQDWLKDASIAWFGNPWNSTSTKMNREHIGDNSPIVTIVSKNGIDVAFVGYHSF